VEPPVLVAVGDRNPGSPSGYRVREDLLKAARLSIGQSWATRARAIKRGSQRQPLRVLAYDAPDWAA
jgi:hypothetical protein